LCPPTDIYCPNRRHPPKLAEPAKNLFHVKLRNANGGLFALAFFKANLISKPKKIFGSTTSQQAAEVCWFYKVLD
jgi:hypothetical protein